VVVDSQQSYWTLAVETSDVIVQVATVHESFLTELTEVRSVVDVQAHVGPQLSAIREGFPALRAEIRSLARVFRHM